MPFIAVLQGPSGTGKSDKLCSFAAKAKTGVIDVDGKFTEIIPNFFNRTNISPNIVVRSPYKTKDKQFIVSGVAGRWQRFKQINQEFCQDPDMRYIAWDTCTEAMNFAKDAIVSSDPKPNMVGGRKIMSLSGWGPLEMDFREEMMRVIAAGKSLLLLVHDKTVEDENTGLKMLVPDMQAGLKNLLPKLASEWWHTETRVRNGKVEYVCCCQPNVWGNWKSSLGLPAEWVLDVEELERRIEQKEKSKGLSNVDTD